MSKNRFSARTDSNEAEIVKALRKLGYQVETGHDDILVAANGRTLWFEIKDPRHVSKKTGQINESAKKPSQKRLEKGWRGHYRIVSSLDEILADIRIVEASDGV